MSAYPKVVLIVNPSGLETTRLVTQTIEQELEGEILLKKLLPALKLIKKACQKNLESTNLSLTGPG
jgi:hypothetical protein